MKSFYFFGLLALVFQLASLHATQKSFSPHLEFTADLLLWSVRESGTENWAEVITSGPGSREVSDIQSVNFKWNSGFRLGAGCDRGSFRAGFFYTKFRGSGDAQVSSIPGSVFSAFLGNFYVDNPNGSGIQGLAYQSASINWLVDFNVLDWEISRAYRLDDALTFHPFLGLKGGWIHQTAKTRWVNPAAPPPPRPFIPFSVGRETLTNNFWGIGPSGGVTTELRLCDTKCHSISFLGTISGAIMYGHWTFSDHYINDADQRVSIVLPKLNSAASTFKTLIGLEWSRYLPSRGVTFTSSLGFEMQFWLNQLQYYSFDTGRLGNVLTLQGGTLAFGIEF